ncbi:hypothetical protein SNEBB_004354 [Seison nebaliae]|nr:hypothetical protein SNEBB_004354 [Seison nebaliae]
MSSTYVTEPPVNGRVIIHTNFGELDVELWGKEAPKAVRNFIQLSMEKYYDNTVFHRIVPSFCVQGGSRDRKDGESIYNNRPFDIEVHSRLRFIRRGLMATANTGRNDNNSQFFFTLAPSLELQGKHTIFGRVSGKTVFNILNISEVVIDKNGYPSDDMNRPTIISIEIIKNPFENEIIPRTDCYWQQKEVENKEKSNSVVTAKGQNKRTLLSFNNDEDDDDNDENGISFIKKSKSGKSIYDLENDEKILKKQFSDEDSDDIVKSSDEIKSIETKEEKKINEKEKTENEKVAEKDVEKVKCSFVEKKKLSKEEHEIETMKMLENFQSKLSKGNGWMSHCLTFPEKDKTNKTIDANVDDPEKYTIIDPRNPINRRRREKKN